MPEIYGDVTLSGGSQAGHFPQVWDLTSDCDLAISFTYDENGPVDDFGSDAHAWAERARSNIREGVMAFCSGVNKDHTLASDSLCLNMVKQIDKYLEKLFNNPMVVNTPEGSVTLYLQRTNNILDQFFRELNRGNRRKTGNNAMQRMLNNMLVDAPLVKNLDNPDYMALLLNDKADFEELFASMNPLFSPKEIQLHSGVDRILSGFRKIIRLRALPEHMIWLAANDH